MTDQTLLRPNVGIVVFNNDNKVLFCERQKRDSSPRPPQYQWQMPQGGIDEGETPLEAAYRELYEETNITQNLVEFLGETGPFDYFYPPDVVKSRPHKKFAGQRQYWMAFQYTGQDSDIDLKNCPDPSFDNWRWEDLHKTAESVIPFKTDVYQKVIIAFEKFTA